MPFGRVRRVIEQDLGARIGRLFDDIDQEPFAVASLRQLHKARTSDGEIVAVKVQRPGRAEAIETDLPSLGLVGPILKRPPPELDARAALAEIRDRISDEFDYALEAPATAPPPATARRSPALRPVRRVRRRAGA